MDFDRTFVNYYTINNGLLHPVENHPTNKVLQWNFFESNERS